MRRSVERHGGLTRIVDRCQQAVRLRTGYQWKALQNTGLRSSSSAHRRLQEWTTAGVFLAFWEQGLAVYAASPRTYSWMNRFRGVLVRWDNTVCNSLACWPLACAYLSYRRSDLLG